MHLRKFYFVVSFILSIFLFSAGLLILQGIGENNLTNKLLGKEILQDFFSGKDPINILVLGGDKVNGNTDTIMVLNYDPSTAKVNLLSIPRDTKVRIEGKSRKINFAYPHGGINLATETISNLLNININYFVYIDTSVFRDVIDELDGVNFYVPPGMDYDDPYQNLHIHLKEGNQKLYGKDAEGLMRFRHPNSFKSSPKALKEYYDGSDLKRIDMQQKFIKELIKQKANIFYLPKMGNVINKVFDKIETNISISDALKLSNNITQIRPEEFVTYKLMGQDQRLSGIWYYVYNNKIINNNTSEVLDAETVLDKCFRVNSGFNNTIYKGTPADDEDEQTTKKKETPKKSYTKSNPSNSDSALKGKKTVRP